MNKKTVLIVVSDNHMLKEPLRDIAEAHPEAEYFIHCGDSEMHPDELHPYEVVRGNNDYPSFPNRRVIEAGGHRILVTHSHLDMYFMDLNMLAAKAEALECDIVCFGHIHRYVDAEAGGVRLLNPGSLWRNRDGSEPSYMVVTLDGDEIDVERVFYKKSKKDLK